MKGKSVPTTVLGCADMLSRRLLSQLADNVIQINMIWLIKYSAQKMFLLIRKKSMKVDKYLKIMNDPWEILLNSISITFQPLEKKPGIKNSKIDLFKLHPYKFRNFKKVIRNLVKTNCKLDELVRV